ncbi:hypothetical protein LCGC14_2877070 [marine sediment metagenome]|uniref:Uncharacterized protein n=1 Tax=marine sediment metagenome TaxID=412755 RepID=A0A0F8YMY6_9ZZZZ
MKAIPKITVRIDRGEDWVELVGDWQSSMNGLVICGEGDFKEWCDIYAVKVAWSKLNEAVTE